MSTLDSDHKILELVDEIFGPLYKESPTLASRTAEFAHYIYGMRKVNEPVERFYDLPEADYKEIAETIEGRVNDETPLNVQVSFSPHNLPLDIISYHSIEAQDEIRIGFSISKHLDRKDRRTLTFRFHRSDLTVRYVEDNYIDLMKQVHEIIEQESQRLT